MDHADQGSEAYGAPTRASRETQADWLTPLDCAKRIVPTCTRFIARRSAPDRRRRGARGKVEQQGARRSDGRAGNGKRVGRYAQRPERSGHRQQGSRPPSFDGSLRRTRRSMAGSVSRWVWASRGEDLGSDSEVWGALRRDLEGGPSPGGRFGGMAPLFRTKSGDSRPRWNGPSW